jgi:hypothetical protein
MPDRTSASAAPGTVVPGEKRGQHNVAIVREMHAFLKSTDSEIRTFGQSKVSVAAQFEYNVLQKAQQMHQRRTRWLPRQVSLRREQGLEPCTHAD